LKFINVIDVKNQNLVVLVKENGFVRSVMRINDWQDITSRKS